MEAEMYKKAFDGPGTDCDPERVTLTDESAMSVKGSARKQVVRQVQIGNRTGLHARPAMQFVDLANKFASRIRVCKDQQSVNAKSIMELLLLAAAEGTVLTIQAEGPDAEEAADALVKLVRSKFEED